MAITVYKSTDASAPTLSGQAGRLIAVLDACLVTGYGSKTAAGWTKSFSGTNLAAYRMTTTSPATGFYLRVDDTGTTSSRIVGYETMSDVNTGTNPFPTAAQQSGGAYAWKSSTADATARPWCLIADSGADPRGFYLIIDANSTTYSTTDTYATIYFFGDIITRKATDGYQCMLMAQNVVPATNQGNGGNVNGGSAYAALRGHWLARAYTAIAGAITCSKSRNYRCASTSTVIGVSDAAAFPDKLTNSLRLATIMVQESAVVLRGTMPGLFEPQGGDFVGNIYDEIVGQGAYTGTTFVIVPTRIDTTTGRGLIQITGNWY